MIGPFLLSSNAAVPNTGHWAAERCPEVHASYSGLVEANSRNTTWPDCDSQRTGALAFSPVKVPSSKSRDLLRASALEVTHPPLQPHAFLQTCRGQEQGLGFSACDNGSHPHSHPCSCAPRLSTQELPWLSLQPPLLHAVLPWYHTLNGCPLSSILSLRFFLPGYSSNSYQPSICNSSLDLQLFSNQLVTVTLIHHLNLF